MPNAKKITTRDRQFAKVVNALNLIWHHPDKSLDLASISRACNVSKYHFHRIFYEYQKETLNSYLTRKRLELVARRLIWYPNQTISDIAKNHGFSSPANFSKAFKIHFGITPKECRNPHLIEKISDSEFLNTYGKELDPSTLYSRYKYLDKAERNMRLIELDQTISIVKLPNQKLLYRTINNGLNESAFIPAWKEIADWGRKNYEDWNKNIFTVWYDPFSVCPLDKIRQDLAIRIPTTTAVNMPYMTQVMNEGFYITGIITGSESDLVHTNRDIHTLWLAERGLAPEKAPYYIHYLNNFYKDGFYKVRFYIKIVTKKG